MIKINAFNKETGELQLEFDEGRIILLTTTWDIKDLCKRLKEFSGK